MHFSFSFYLFLCEIICAVKEGVAVFFFLFFVQIEV